MISSKGRYKNTYFGITLVIDDEFAELKMGGRFGSISKYMRQENTIGKSKRLGRKEDISTFTHQGRRINFTNYFSSFY